MFTVFQSICGALLIQFATSSFLAEAGKTVGFSSIAYNTFFNPSVYPLSIVTGLLASTALVYTFIPQFLPPTPTVSLLYSLVSGIFVGFGTSWGHGCTSGHMLCGISLLRVRSFIATLVFAGVAMAVVNIFDLAPSCGDGPCYRFPQNENEDEYLQLGLTVAVGFVVSKIRLNRIFSGFKAGLLFGLGLYISGMANPAKPLGFLSVFHKDKFDPSLGMIMIFAVLPNIIEWQLILRSEPKPFFEEKYSLPTATQIPVKFLVGCALFGIGWGMQGVCPGPGILNSVLSWNGAVWFAGFLGGYASAKRI